MLNVVIGAIIALVAAVMAIFLILMAINVALVVRLRSIIPPSPQAKSSAALHRVTSSENARR